MSININIKDLFVGVDYIDDDGDPNWHEINWESITIYKSGTKFVVSKDGTEYDSGITLHLS